MLINIMPNLLIWIHLFFTMEKAMATHSSTLAWKISWVEEPGRLQSMGWLRVGHDWATSLSLFTFMHWRRKWQPTPMFLPGESQGRGGMVDCHRWGCTESDTTDVTYQSQLPASWETHMQVKKQQNWTCKIRLVPNWKRSMSRLYIVILLI